MILKEGDPLPEPKEPERAHYIFQGWSDTPSNEGDTSSGGNWVFDKVPKKHLTLYGTWTPVLYPVKVETEGNGTAAASATEAARGSEITLTATPDEHCHFKEWQVIAGGVSISEDNKFTMPGGEVKIKAVFEENRYEVRVETEGNGTAAASATEAVRGSEITLTATPGEDYHFKGWQVIEGGVSISEDNKFTMPGGEVRVKAVFEENRYKVRVETEGNGTATASATEAARGSEITLTATPEEGYHFKEWQVLTGGVSINAGNSFTMPGEDVAVKAVFEKDVPPEPGHAHSWPAGWSADGSHHWHECSCGEKSGMAAHDYIIVITKSPSCEAQGVRTYTCICGHSYTESIAALGHAYERKVTKEPTASEEGEAAYTCGRCGAGYTEPIQKLENMPPEPGTPFVKGAFEKNGWAAIREEADRTKEPGTVTVVMNGISIVPGDVLEQIRGRDITMVFEMGNGITWSVNGKSVWDGNIGDIDLYVETGTTAIPLDIVNNVTGERYSIQISLKHNGEFGFTAVLSINLDKKNAGLYASLYHYREDSDSLERMCSERIAEDGTVELTFTHASDYLIVIDEEAADSMESLAPPENGSRKEPVDGDAGPTSPRTGEGRKKLTAITIGFMLLLMLGLGEFLILKKRKEDRHDNHGAP